VIAAILLLLAQVDAAGCVEKLLPMQDADGAWPYEGVYRVRGEIPVGYRVGGTSIVAGALIQAAPADDKVRQAVDRGLNFVLKHLADPLLEPSIEDVYDVRVWGQAAALDFLCQGRQGPRAKEIDGWIERLVKTLTIEEIPGGGWNYARHDSPASFVTVPVVQALLFAKGQGFEVSKDLLDRARKSLEAARADDGAFLYSGKFKEGQARKTSDELAGAAARAAGCEATLRLLGGGSTENLQGAVNAFNDHWADLEKRAKKTGTHEGPYKIAPYYFFYGHRYAAQAIQLLPEARRAAERDRLLPLILKTRDADGTWNDRVFGRSRNYGTTMILLALLSDRATLPPGVH
jgi:hypothetical protein